MAANQNWSKPCQYQGRVFQFQEDHEIRQVGISVHAPRADLTHQVHPDCVAAQGKEGRVTEAENTAVAPDEINRNRQYRVRHVFAEERDRVGGDVERGGFRYRQIQKRNYNRQKQERPQQNTTSLVGAKQARKGTRGRRCGQREGQWWWPSSCLGCPAFLREDAAWASLDKQNEADEYNDFSQHCAGERLEYLIDDTQGTFHRSGCPTGCPRRRIRPP